MEREQARQALIEARRTRLTRVLGGTSRTREVAERLVDADLLRAAARFLDEEVDRLDALGLGIQAGQAKARATSFHRRADRLEREAAMLEAECFPGCDRERYLDLRSRMGRTRRPADARNLANELLLGRERLGFLAAEHLWDLLERACARREVPFPRDLYERFREELEAVRREDERADRARTARDLLAAALQVDADAPHLDKEDLLDRIVATGARLKILQEDRERRGLPTDRPIPELDDEGQAIRQAFGILTRVSKEHRPGHTDVLNRRARHLDWGRLARAAEERLRAREADRARRREEARRKQITEARERWRKEVRRLAFQEALDRLRALLDRDGHDGVFREAARAEAAIACRLAEGDEEQLARIADLLAGRLDLVATGRAFRALRRQLGIEPVPEVEEEAPATEDLADEVADEAAAEAVLPWPDWVLERQDAGRGERVLLVGGLPSDRRLTVLRNFFGWDDARWIESYRDHSADFDALKKQIRAGRWDRVVALTRFCGHDVTQALSAATAKGKVPFLRHPRSPTIPALAATLYGAGPRR